MPKKGLIGTDVKNPQANNPKANGTPPEKPTDRSKKAIAAAKKLLTSNGLLVTAASTEPKAKAKAKAKAAAAATAAANPNAGDASVAAAQKAAAAAALNTANQKLATCRPRRWRQERRMWTRYAILPHRKEWGD